MIKGLTDNITPRYARIGKLRKGGEKTANGYGPDLDYFRFTAESPEVVKAFQAAYPNKPREIRIFIPHDTVEAAFATHCELWSRSGLQHRCDGQTMHVWREGSRYVRGAKPCPGGHKDNDPLRDSVGRLEFIIPKLVERGYVGYVTLETHSVHDVMNISRVLSAVYKSQGTLAGVEFILRRVKENISVPGFGDRKGDRSRTDKWLVRLEPSPEWVRAVLATQRINALQVQTPQPAAAIEAPRPSPEAEHDAPPTEAAVVINGAEPGGPNSDLTDEPPPVGTDISAEEQQYFGDPPKPAAKSVKPESLAKKPNAKAKSAAIRVPMNRYNEWCKTFVGQFPDWQDEEGNPDRFHIGCSFAACGFKEVTKDNFEAATAALIHRASEKQLAQA